MTSKDTAISHARVWTISFPLILSNVTQPLLGLVDTAVIGRLDDEVYLGAIALGAMIFSFIYWGFGFLRMGTTGFVAQAHGSDDYAGLKATMVRAIAVAVGLGLLTLLLQWPIASLTFWLVPGSAEVEQLARDYFFIRIWSSPLTLINYACLGYLIGMGLTRTALLLQVFLNGMNIILDVLFVLGFGWGVDGVALGTALSETATAFLGLAIIWRHARGLPGHFSLAALSDAGAIRTMLLVNTDIFIRTAAMLICFSWFTAQGARAGDLTLAANAILMQFIYFSAYALDGFAQAAEVLAGNAVGRLNRAEFRKAVKISTQWAGLIALVMSGFYAVTGPFLIDLLTTLDQVRDHAREFLWWVVLLPVIGVWCFQLDGIFIGATHTKALRNAMLASMVIFFSAFYLLQEQGNHGLWAALTIFFAARGLTLAVFYPGLERDRTDAHTSET